MNRIDLKRVLSLLAALLLTVAALLPAYAAPDEGGRVPYRFSLDSLNGYSTSGDMIGVIRDLRLPIGESLHAEGWLATAEGVSAYQYLWVAPGGAGAVWKTVENAEIFSRKELAQLGVSYPSGHGTAGFRLTISPPEGIGEGVYDVYIRALDGMGNPCDVVALLNLRYGDPDVDNGSTRLISLPRIAREGAASAQGKAMVTETGAVLSEEGRIRLGELNLTAFELVRITYTVAGAGLDADIGDGRRPVLGLKSSGDHGYGQAGEPYNLTDNLVYAAPTMVQGEGVLDIDLSTCDYYGDVWLTGYVGSQITVTSVEFFYKGRVPSRVAAKIYLSEDLVGDYFSGMNYTAAIGVQDPVLGDVLRLEVTESTNDPFAFFHAGKLLSDHGIALDADEYKYMVILYRAEAHNNSDRMNLYLCSGPITGATEDCNQGTSLKPDGKWHYLLVDLSQKANWGGSVNGWRFDYISASCNAGEAVEFASVQFFRTVEAAKKAAALDPAKQSAFHRGDDPILRDMSEEGNGETGDDAPFVIPPEDSYVVTEAETQPVTEPASGSDPDPADTTAASSAETDPPKGCASAAAGSLSGLLGAAALLLLRKKD